MTGWFEYSIFLGASTVLTIIIKKLKGKYYDNGITVEMIVEVTRKASQAHIQRFYHANNKKTT
jgi:hypothetical protein